jgi:hypothetical protein
VRLSRVGRCGRWPRGSCRTPSLSGFATDGHHIACHRPEPPAISRPPTQWRSSRHLLRRGRGLPPAPGGGIRPIARGRGEDVGVCLDTCHMAVEETRRPPSPPARRPRARVLKVQLSSALRYRTGSGSGSPASVLGRFAEDTYLHRVIVGGPHGLTTSRTSPAALRLPAKALRSLVAGWRPLPRADLPRGDVGLRHEPEHCVRSSV